MSILFVGVLFHRCVMNTLAMQNPYGIMVVWVGSAWLLMKSHVSLTAGVLIHSYAPQFCQMKLIQRLSDSLSRMALWSQTATKWSFHPLWRCTTLKRIAALVIATMRRKACLSSILMISRIHRSMVASRSTGGQTVLLMWTGGPKTRQNWTP